VSWAKSSWEIYLSRSSSTVEVGTELLNDFSAPFMLLRQQIEEFSIA
jgi:hypothetical protein